MTFVSSAGARIPHGRFTPVPTPVLLMHFDGNYTDAIGITTFTASGSSFTAGTSGFGQKLASSGGPQVYGVSTQELSIGTRQFTIEGRSTFGSGQTGGIVLSKCYWETATIAAGWFTHDFSINVTPTLLEVQWDGMGAFDATAALSTTTDVEFHWAISDDGANMRFYKDGVLIQTRTSAALASVTPPVVVGSGLTVGGFITGFAGDLPSWTTMNGKLDELVMWLDYAKYTGATYTVPTAPYAF